MFLRHSYLTSSETLGRLGSIFSPSLTSPHGTWHLTRECWGISLSTASQTPLWPSRMSWNANLCVHLWQYRSSLPALCVVEINLSLSVDYTADDPPDPPMRSHWEQTYVYILVHPSIYSSFSQLTLQPTLLTRRGPPQPHSQPYTYLSSSLRSHPPPTLDSAYCHVPCPAFSDAFPDPTKWNDSPPLNPFNLGQAFREGIVFCLIWVTGVFVQISRLVHLWSSKNYISRVL